MRILIEGMDMTGKDATADSITSVIPGCKKRNSVIAACNPHYLQAAKLAQDGGSEDQVVGLLLESIRFDFNNCLNGECCNQSESENILQVSLTAFRSFAYHFEKSPETAERFLGCLMTYSEHLREFDKVVLLDANLETRRKRLEAQGQQATENDKKLLADQGRVDSTDKAIKLVLTRCLGGGKFLTIDTSNMTVVQVASVVKYYCGLNQ